MRTKIVVLIIAVILGLLSAFAVVSYIEGARATIEAEDKPVEVLVAQQDLPAGLSAEELMAEEYVALVEIPRRYVADGAVSSLGAIKDRLLTVPLTKGEQLTANRFSLPSEAGLSFAVPEDYVAIAIPNSADRGVAGLVRPGDSVAVYATFELEPNRIDTAVTRLILQKARVLAVGASTTTVSTTDDEDEEEANTGTLAGAGARAGTEPDVPGTVTLALSPADAEKLVFAQEEGAVWLALLGSGTTEVPVTPGQRFPGVIE